MHDLSFFHKDRPLLLIGCGKMGSALVVGWLHNGLSQDSLHLVDPCIFEVVPPEAKEASLHVALSDVPPSLTPGIVILAVKPQVMGTILPQLANIIDRQTLVLSIAAGTRIARIREEIGAAQKLIRSMPNTPSAIGKGVAVLVASAECESADRDLATQLFSVSGEVHWIEDEVYLDAVTGLSGSGPAYVFYLVEVMAEGGVAAGLEPKLARALARRTVIGAGALLEASPESFEQLRKNVTSPKGTTEAALDILTKDGAFQDLIVEAILAATNRGKELSNS